MSTYGSNVDRKVEEVDVRSREIDLVHATAENADGETELTIYPDECDDAALVTTWITATGEAFVALDAMR